MLVRRILDFLFPPFCVGCQRSGKWWCNDCQRKVEFIKNDICSKCLHSGQHDCCGNLFFKKVISVGYYHDPILRSVITNLKFQGVFVLEKELNNFLENWEINDIDYDLLNTVDVIVPMPLAKKRWRERGFNQSLILARVFKNRLNLSVAINQDLLIRDDLDYAQSELNHELALRKLNVKGSFVGCKHSFKRILLVDDVLTTGATAQEAMNVLIKNGAEEVIILTLALGT